MAEQELKIRLEIEGKGADATAAELKRIVNEVKLLDIQMRQGARSAQDVERATKNLELQLQKAFSTGKISAEQYRKTLVSVFGVSEHAETRFISMARSIHGMEKNVHAGTTALFSFGNIIQDSSQFSMGFGQGIRAISNNITQMTQQMVYMVAATGSTAVAFRTLWVSMMGPAGILLAISAITTAITLFATQQKETKKQTDEARKAIDAQRKAIEDTTKAIDNYNKQFKGGTPGARLAATEIDIKLQSARLQATEDYIEFLKTGKQPIVDNINLSREQVLAYEQQIDTLARFKTANVETFTIIRDEIRMNLEAARAARQETTITGPRPTRLTQEMPMADVDKEIRRSFMMSGMDRMEEFIDRDIEEGFRKAFARSFEAGEREFTAFDNMMVAGFRGAAQAIEQTMINAFRNMFGAGKSFLADFLSAFLGAFVGHGLGIAASTLWKNILAPADTPARPIPIYIPKMPIPIFFPGKTTGEGGRFVLRGSDLVLATERTNRTRTTKVQY